LNKSKSRRPFFAVTTGEPAGIGPDVSLMLCQQALAAEIVLLGDINLLAKRSRQLGLKLQLKPFAADEPETWSEDTEYSETSVRVLHIPLVAPAEAGVLNPDNGPYVLEMLRTAGEACLAGIFSAVVTAPVQKSVINDSGIAFSGHTEFFASLCGAPRVVMLLASKTLRVALATTHLPLRAVPDALNESLLKEVITILHSDLQSKFGFAEPRIQICGLNPHAGEDGHLGTEEQTLITPVINQLKAMGLALTGPVPADTAFNQDRLSQFDATLAMYHDQGLPTLKHSAFGEAVNITLGLPIIRTSVDHGTALDLAGTGQAKAESLIAAAKLAIQLASH